MEEVIQHELELGLVCFCWGIALLAVYDVLRIVRRVIKHNIIAISLEDFLFWLLFLAGTFELLRRKNNGIFRYSVIIAAAAGMVLYHFLLGRYAVPLIAGGLNRIKRAVKKWKSLLTAPIKRVMIKLCKSVKASYNKSRFAQKRRILKEYKKIKAENAAKKRIGRRDAQEMKYEKKRSVSQRKEQ